MTVLAFDGKTLASDKQATSGGMKRTMTKVYRLGDLVVGFTGDAAQGMEMVEWVKRGRIAAEFPAAQRKSEDYAETVVIDGGKVLIYETTPYPIAIEDPVFATGSGREYALAAMYCGMDARKAVVVACQFDTGCGMGVDGIDLVA